MKANNRVVAVSNLGSYILFDNTKIAPLSLAVKSTYARLYYPKTRAFYIKCLLAVSSTDNKHDVQHIDQRL